MEKLAICIIAYNEAENIASLIDRILKENFDSYKIIIYTDGSIDGTAEIVASYKERFPDLIVYLKGKRNLGKVPAFNAILQKIKKYETAMFLDADICPENGSLANLYKCLISSNDACVVSPLLLAYTKGLKGYKKTLADLYSKARVHAAKYNRHRYFSGRIYCIRTKKLTPIPQDSYFDDFYLNAKIPYEEIRVCTDSVIYFRRPTSICDFIRYNARLGRAQANIRANHRNLWKTLQKRISIINYAFFDLTKFKFLTFFSQLSFVEKMTFLSSRPIAALSMFFGFFTYKSNPIHWKRIVSTKINYK